MFLIKLYISFPLNYDVFYPLASHLNPVLTFLFGLNIFICQCHDFIIEYGGYRVPMICCPCLSWLHKLTSLLIYYHSVLLTHGKRFQICLRKSLLIWLKYRQLIFLNGDNFNEYWLIQSKMDLVSPYSKRAYSSPLTQ